MYDPIQIRLSGEFQDINPLFLGISPPNVQNSNVKAIRPYTLIHYVLSGSGTFVLKGREYHVHEGQAFVAPPGEDAYWTANAEAPWSYRWIGFTGKFSYDFAALPPVFDISPELLPLQCNPVDPKFSNKAISFRVVSELMLLLSTMQEVTLRNPDYAQTVMEYVRSHYAEKISITELAASLNLSRSYLSDYFKKKTGLSIQSYILNTRLEISRHHLLDGKSVKEASKLSGFSAVSNFTKLFTRESGISPSQFRKQTLTSFEQHLWPAPDCTDSTK